MRAKMLVCTGLALIMVMIIGLAAAQDSSREPLSDEATLALLHSSGLHVFPVEDLAEEPLLLEDLTPTSAQLRFVSNRAVNCIVLYGETPQFGSAAQDADMSGVVHADHHPILTGLQPDTQYFYRVQGSDEAGNVYVSDVFTFRTLPAGEATSDNLLSPLNGATIVAVSSNYNNQPNEGSNWGAANAFDDNPGTAWSSNGDGNEAFVEVRLGQRSRIHTISFWTRTMSNDTAQIYSFTVTTDAGEIFGPFALPDPDEAYEFEVDIEADTLRFDVVESNGGNTGAVEIAAYGEPVDD